MRRSPVSELGALACALLTALPYAQAQQAPDKAPTPAEVAESAQHDDTPAPTLESIAAAFDPVAGGLTAEEIVRQAVEHSPDLAKASLSLDTAAANQARARIAFAPRIDLSGKYSHLSEFKLSPFNIPGAPADSPGFAFPQFRNQFYSQAAASLPITDIFLTVIPQYKAAAKSQEVAAARKAASELEVSHNARVAFYQYAHVIGAVVVAKESVRLQEAGVRDLESLVQAGTATETDLIRAKAALGNARVQAIEYEGMQEVAVARLTAITGSPVDSKRPIGERFVNIQLAPTPDVSNLASEAKNFRPELIALRKLEQTREYLSQARRGAQAPKLSGFGNFYYANPHPRQIPAEDKWRQSWDVGVMLSWSPNDSIYAHTQYKDALTELASVREDLRLIQDGIGVEVTQAATKHRTALAAIQSTSEALEAARRYQVDQRSLMLAGVRTPNDVLEAQVLLTRAALEWVAAYIDARIAEAGLLKAQGKTGLNQGSTVSRSSTP